jgi:hypothetical protein
VEFFTTNNGLGWVNQSDFLITPTRQRNAKFFPYAEKRISFMNKLLKSTAAVTIMALAASNANATNGMNQESYGAKAGGMGGASVAYDSRNSGMMNNPATLALRPDGWDFGIGFTLLCSPR